MYSALESGPIRRESTRKEATLCITTWATSIALDHWSVKFPDFHLIIQQELESPVQCSPNTKWHFPLSNPYLTMSS